jgi:hypothetical protein
MGSASAPTLGDHPQTILNSQIIARCQLLVAIFWSKLGTPTPTATSRHGRRDQRVHPPEGGRATDAVLLHARRAAGAD